MLPVDEFGLIERLFAPLAKGFPGALDLKDDAALVAPSPGCSIVVTADALVAGEHFLPTDPPDAVARKAVRTNISDLAAMAAKPLALLLTIALPRDITIEWLDGFAAGLKMDIEEFGVSLIGGDTVATAGPMALSITAMGEAEPARTLRRSNARSGDVVWVSGSIGDGALGLFVELGQGTGIDPSLSAFLLDRYRLPRPRVALGRALPGLAHAAMDISDGLVGDLGHICDVSDVGAVIEADKVPLSAAARAAISAGWGKGLETVLTGGDDYELLFTAPESATEALRVLSDSLALPLTPIGRVVAGKGVCVMHGGQRLTIDRGGHRHF